MKKINIIIFIISFLLLILPTYVFAAESQVIIDGDNTVKPGETKNITIKISSEVEIGIVSGKLEKDNNISSMTLTGKNNWNLTYNSATGEFNIYKAEGAKNEEIINIEYTAGNTEGTGKITISNIKMTSIDYETKEIENISKEITIKEDVKLSSIEITKAPTKTTYTAGEKFDATGMELTAKYTDESAKIVTNYTYDATKELEENDTKIIITYSENGITKTVEQKITVVGKQNNSSEEFEKDNIESDGEKEDSDKDTTKANQKIPNAGEENYLAYIAVVIAIIASVSYFKYRKYKGI